MGEEITPGKELEIAFDGLRMLATVTALRDKHFEITIPLRLPATSFSGVRAEVRTDDADVVSFDLGAQGTFTELRVAVPWPEARGTPDEFEAPAPEPVEQAPVEKRQFFRLPVSVGVEVYDNDAVGPVRAIGSTVNISGGGMLINLGAPLLQRVYRFKIQLPDDELEIKGLTLLRPGLAHGCVAVQFVDCNENLRSRIVRFIFGKLRSLRNTKAVVGAIPEGTAASATTKQTSRDRRALRLENRAHFPRFRRWRQALD